MDPENKRALVAMIKTRLDEEKEMLTPFVKCAAHFIREAFASGAKWKIESPFYLNKDSYIHRVRASYSKYVVELDHRPKWDYDLSTQLTAALDQLTPKGYMTTYDNHGKFVVSCEYEVDSTERQFFEKHYSGRWVVGPVIQPLRILLVPSPLLPKPGN